MSLFSKFFRRNLPVLHGNTLMESFHVPEPTKSLLFITDEDPSKIQSPMSLAITVTLTDTSIKSESSDGKNIYGEPSAIWTRLPVRKNDWLEEKPMYYPSYHGLSPEHRYQYLMWLKDVTKSTNLSYVFLYYYGLERHLLLGNFDLAFQEIVTLLQSHDKGTLRSYAETALIVSCLYRKRFDLIRKNHFLYDGISNEEMLLRKYMGINITTKELMLLASNFGMKNRQYIKLYPDDFERELEKVLVNYEAQNGRLLDSIKIDALKKEDVTAFANYSLKEKIRTIKIPNLIRDARFSKTCRSLLEQAHKNFKATRNTT